VKLLLYALTALSVSTVPAVCFAQSTVPLTRAQVIAQLIEVENAGFHPGSVDYVEYPDNLQAAEARVAAEHVRHISAPKATGVPQ
jgi:hypothetical protein